MKISSVATATAPLQLGTVSHVNPPGDVGGVYVLDVFGGERAPAPQACVGDRTHAAAGSFAYAADTAGVVDVIGTAP